MALENINLGGMSAGVINFMTSAFFWVILVIAILALAMGGLFLFKRSKYKIHVLKWIQVGDKKVIVESTKAGWFGKDKIFLNLIDRGKEQQLEMKDGNVVQQVSSEDYQDFNGHRAIFVKRKDDDPRIWVPLKSFKVDNEEVLASIAPGDFRDAGTALMKEADREIMGNSSLVMQYVAIIGVILLVIFAVIFITKFGSDAVEKITMRCIDLTKDTVQTTVSSAP